MIASIENVRQFLKDCLAVDDLQAYDCCKIMSEKYGVYLPVKQSMIMQD